MTDNRLVFLCPFKAEARLLLGIFPDCKAISETEWQFKHGRVICCNGAGAGPLLQTMVRLSNPAGVGGIVLFGAAGALTRGLTIGQVFAVDSVHYQGDSLAINAPHGFAAAGQVTVDKPVEAVSEREALFQQTKASIVDMESYYFVKQAREGHSAHAIIRFISDTPERCFHPDNLKQAQKELQGLRKKLLNIF